ncbi:MAG: hypothetical protein ACI9F9_002430 [Candidatus Paceibacteria bacterium]
MKALASLVPVLFVLAGIASPAEGSRPFSSAGRTATQEESSGQNGSDEERALQAKIEKYLDLAQNGRVAVRPQAAKRLVKLGPPALVKIIEACGQDGANLPNLGPYLVEVLADFADPGLRALLWERLADPDFPWRGPAARSLSHNMEAQELPDWLRYLSDPLGQVRLAAADSFGQLSAQEARSGGAHAAFVTRAQVDPDARVRRAICLQLDAWGDHGYLLWLVEDLKRSDAYFRLPLGEQARFASIRALRKIFGKDDGYRAEAAPTEPENALAIQKLQAAVLARTEGEAPRLPELVLAGQSTPGDVLGLELRSCRVGEFFLRWNENDILYLGTGRARAIQLKAGAVARLQGELRTALQAIDETRYWGAAGCDIEQLRLVNAAGSVDTFLVSKGQAAVRDLRPRPLDAAVRLLVDSIPAGATAFGGHSLRAEVSRALESLGGEFRDS